VTAARQVLPKIVSRLALAILLGVMLAEPLLLGIFHTAVEERVAASRQESILRLESELRLCNGLALGVERPEGNSAVCEGRRLESSEPVLFKHDELSRTRREADMLRVEIDAISDKASRLQQDAIRE
jgi:hypothetical protein